MLSQGVAIVSWLYRRPLRHNAEVCSQCLSLQSLPCISPAAKILCVSLQSLELDEEYSTPHELKVKTRWLTSFSLSFLLVKHAFLVRKQQDRMQAM